MATFAIAGPATNASAATVSTARTTASVPLSFGCPVWYGIPNPANGCEPYWAIELGFLDRFWLRH
jgi:hypothetical protein